MRRLAAAILIVQGHGDELAMRGPGALQNTSDALIDLLVDRQRDLPREATRDFLREGADVESTVLNKPGQLLAPARRASLAVASSSPSARRPLSSSPLLYRTSPGDSASPRAGDRHRIRAGAGPKQVYPKKEPFQGAEWWGVDEKEMAKPNVQDQKDIDLRAEEGGQDAMGLEQLVRGGRTLVVGVQVRKNMYNTFKGDDSLDTRWTIHDSLDELERLCKTAGMEVYARDYQIMQSPVASTYIGSGKVVDIARTVQEYGIETVVFDDELSPAQQRNLQERLEAQVVDRTLLILYVFAQRARTKEAILQVELARWQYLMPRLQTFLTTGAGMEAKGGGASTGGGGQNMKGVGETQLELDRRLTRMTITKIKRDLEQVRSARGIQRSARKKRAQTPLVALVGYTNAGKSSMLNTLTRRSDAHEDEVYADDLLFATLDPTMRKLSLNSGREVMIADTVGFIQKLPTKLVNAFRATLEVCEDADVILHIVDSSSPIARQQAWSVGEILSDLNASHTPHILALNKEDALRKATGKGPELSEWVSIHQNVTPNVVIPVSATLGNNLPNLLDAIEKELLDKAVLMDVVVPYARGDLVSEIHQAGTVVSEDYTDQGTHIVAHVPPILSAKLETALGAGSVASSAA